MMALTEKVDSKVMASVLFIDFTVVRQSVTLKQGNPFSTALFKDLEKDCGNSLIAENSSLHCMRLHHPISNTECISNSDGPGNVYIKKDESTHL